MENKEYYYDQILNHLNDLQETDTTYCHELDLIKLTQLESKSLEKIISGLRKLGYISYFWISGMQQGHYSITSKGEEFITSQSFGQIRKKASFTRLENYFLKYTEPVLLLITAIFGLYAYFYPRNLNETESMKVEMYKMNITLDRLSFKLDSLSKASNNNIGTSTEKLKASPATTNLIKTTSSHISSPVLNKNTKAIAK